MKILKHGIYFSLVKDKIVHCPKCHCVFTIEKIDDIYYIKGFSCEGTNVITSINTTCPECSRVICLESEVKLNG